MKRMSVLIGIVLIALASVAPGAGAGSDAKPKSAAAKAALRKYEQAMEEARQTFAREVEVVRKHAVGELTVALKSATRAANLDEANHLSATIKGMSGSEPNPRVRPELGGAWQVVFTNGNRHIYKFPGDETVQNTPAGQAAHTAKLGRDGAGVIADYGGAIDRFSLAGERLFVESFPSNAGYPDRPADVASGLPEQAKETPKPAESGAEPRSAAAKAALRKYAKAMDKARQTYAREAKAAKKAAAAELTVALKAATRAAALEEANRTKETIDALREAGPPGGDGGSDPGTGTFPKGTWEVTYLNGNRQLYAFDGRGGVRSTPLFVSSGPIRGQLDREGADLIVRFPADVLERFSFAGDRLFVEHFRPASHYPDEATPHIATGLPARNARPGK